MATASERLWRTADGRLVPDGDEAAERLAYAPGDEITARDEHLLSNTDKPKTAAKAAAKPADKAAAKPADK